MLCRIGRYWDGQGGIFAGITPKADGDYCLIRGNLAQQRDVIWREAREQADAFQADGHFDFRLPTREEAALLYANLRGEFEDKWYWTGDTYHADPKCAWVQTFGYGRQADARMTDACRVVAVRVFRVPE